MYTQNVNHCISPMVLLSLRCELYALELLSHHIQIDVTTDNDCILSLLNIQQIIIAPCRQSIDDPMHVDFITDQPSVIVGGKVSVRKVTDAH